MQKQAASEFELMMWQALSADIGLCIATSDPEQLRTKLYAERRKCREAEIFDFDQLQFRISPENPKGELWIQKKQSQQESSNAEG